MMMAVIILSGLGKNSCYYCMSLRERHTDPHSFVAVPQTCSTALPKFFPANIPTNPSAAFWIPSVTSTLALIEPSDIHFITFCWCSLLYLGPMSGSTTKMPCILMRERTITYKFLMPYCSSGGLLYCEIWPQQTKNH